MIVYKITNTLNEDFYVGKTVTKIEYRFAGHMRSANNNSNTHLHSAIRKYGHGNFKIEIIDEAKDKDELILLEREWIAKLKPRYNMTSGGEGGNTFVGYTKEQLEERKKNLSKGIKAMWDNMPTEERSRRGMKTKNNTDQIKKGVKVSLSRKKLFLEESDDAKRIRSDRQRKAFLQMPRRICIHCNKEIDPGNHSRHEKVCLEMQNKPRSKIYDYALIDPYGKFHNTNSLKKFCNENNLSAYLLKKYIGSPVSDLSKNTNNATPISYSTIGWSLSSVSVSS